MNLKVEYQSDDVRKDIKTAIEEALLPLGFKLCGESCTDTGVTGLDFDDKGTFSEDEVALNENVVFDK